MRQEIGPVTKPFCVEILIAMASWILTIWYVVVSKMLMVLPFLTVFVLPWEMQVKTLPGSDFVAEVGLTMDRVRETVLSSQTS